MNDKTLDAIFGSAERIKIIRIFVFNPEKSFSIETISAKTFATKSKVAREIKNLSKIGLIEKKKAGSFILNKSWQYLSALENFLLSTNPSGEDIAFRISKAGKIKLVAMAGIFTQDKESRLDLLIVGDNIKKPLLSKAIELLQRDIGKEISFSVFDSAEFKYRVEMRDKLVMDVLDFPHEKIVNKLGI